MRSFLRNKFKKCSAKETDKSRKDRGNNNSLSSKSNVNEEYLKALRSNSYEEIWDKAHDQLGFVTMTSTTSVNATGIISSSSSSSNLSSPFYLDLSECLLSPRQETLETMIQRLDIHRFLIEYFEASLRACNICELLLRSINQTRSDHRRIKRVVKMSKRVVIIPDSEEEDEKDDDTCQKNRYCRAIVREMKCIASMKNPLSVMSPAQVRAIREGFAVLFRKLTVKGERMKRRERAKKGFKKAGSIILSVAHNALLVTLLILAFHTVFGIVAAPTLVGCSSIDYLRKKKRNNKKGGKSSNGELVKRAGEEFEIAAKGIFILVNDFDTTCQMVRRLQGEIEHRRCVAEIGARNGNKIEVVREVVKELGECEAGFVEQLEELEEHVYLSLLTINRSRRLVAREIIANCHLR